MKNIRNIIIGFAIGAMSTLVLMNYTLFKEKIQGVDWSSVTYWFTLLIGALIPITVNYFLIKKQEIIKLKAKLAEEDIQLIKKYKFLLSQMTISVMSDKTIEDLDFKYELTPYDISGEALRVTYILEDEDRFSQWRVNNTSLQELVESLGNEELSNYIWYFNSYIHNVDLVRQKLNGENVWKLAFIIREDLRNINRELNKILEKHLDEYVYKFKKDKISYKEKDKMKKSISEKIEKTNFYKYRMYLLKEENQNSK